MSGLRVWGFGFRDLDLGCAVPGRNATGLYGKELAAINSCFVQPSVPLSGTDPAMLRNSHSCSE